MKFATLTKPLKGKFTRWKKGETVIAEYIVGSGYFVQKLVPRRVHRNGIALPLLNQLAGVPRSALKMIKPKKRTCGKRYRVLVDFCKWSGTRHCTRPKGHKGKCGKAS